jgi:hypothetical protein
MILAPMNVLGHVGYAVLPGATDFALGDTWAIETTLTPAVIQTFFTRFYQYALPSDTSGDETIPDSLVAGGA